jgi:hypothetical protein
MVLVPRLDSQAAVAVVVEHTLVEQAAEAVSVVAVEMP